jgi:hypothetical protein
MFFLEGRGEKTIWLVFRFMYIPQMRLPVAIELAAACNSSKESSLANLKYICSENEIGALVLVSVRLLQPINMSHNILPSPPMI